MDGYKYSIEIDRLKAIAPLIEKHFGLGIGYFTQKRKEDTPYVEIDFPCSYEDFKSCFKSEREFINKDGKTKQKKCDLPDIPENALVIDAIWLMMSVCCVENWEKEMPEEFGQYMPSFTELCNIFDEDPKTLKELTDDMQEYLYMNYNDWLTQFYEVKAKKDLLELYIYHIRKIKEKSLQNDTPTQLTIKYGKGKSIKLENKDNWFERVLLRNHFDKYLPDIKSEEDAIKALNVLNHPGRKLPRPLMYHFIYNTYSMVSEHLSKTAVSESFCELLIELMEQMDYPTTYIYKSGDKEGDLKDVDTMYIRKIISKLKQDAKKFKFNLDILLTYEEAKDSLSKLGRSLYHLMG